VLQQDEGRVDERRQAAFKRLLDGLFARFVSVSAAELHDALQTTVTELGLFVDADRSYIISFDWDAGTTTMTHEWCAPGVESCFEAEQDLSIEVGPRQQARLEALEVNQIDDVDALGPDWAEDKEFLASEGVTAILEVPFTLDGLLAGVIGFDAVDGPVAWRAEDVTVLKAVASLLANVLARSRTESALASTLDQLRTVFGDAPVPLMLMSPDGHVLRANRAAAGLFGQAPDDVVGTNALDRIHPDDLRDVIPRWATMLDAHGPEHSAEEIRFLTPAGHRWYRVDARATRTAAGEFTYSTVHLVDIDQARRTASQLGRSERRFGSLVESLPDAVMRFDRDRHVTFANAAAIRISDEMEAAGVAMEGGWPRLSHSASSTLNEALNHAFDSARTVTVEYVIGSGGTEMWTESTFVPECTADGAVESVLLLARDITERRRHEEDLAYRATHDNLTGLPNRSMLLSALAEANQTLDSSPDGAPVAVLFLDIDRFKTINDSLGHGIGDELLCKVAERFSTALRPTDTLARLGGDEFTVLLPDTDAGDAVTVAERLQSTLLESFDIAGVTFRPTTSIGVVEWTEPTDPTDVLRWADAAMYEAKAQGRNRICVFDDRMRAEVGERNDIDRDLTGALERREFRLLFQPEVDIRTGRALGCEALIRWEHPTRGLMSPDRFIPIAEDNGSIVAIGEWVLREACRTVADWISAGWVDDEFVMRVNLSPRQLDQPGLAAQVAAALTEVGLDPAQLCLEVTETAIMRDVEAGLRALNDLHAVGVALAVDDFGTGYSSLSYLKRFPLDVLKIDRSFVDGIPDEPHDLAITTAILELSRSLGLLVTAEGVETEAQRLALIDMGCSRAQGYLFGRPMPADDLVAWTRATTTGL